MANSLIFVVNVDSKTVDSGEKGNSRYFFPPGIVFSETEKVGPGGATDEAREEGTAVDTSAFECLRDRVVGVRRDCERESGGKVDFDVGDPFGCGNLDGERKFCSNWSNSTCKGTWSFVLTVLSLAELL